MFKDKTKPCWMMKDAHCTLQGNECRYCIVYRFGSLCIEDIKELLHNQSSGDDAKVVIEHFLDRKLEEEK
jgi:hypothetical protein